MNSLIKGLAFALCFVAGAAHAAPDFQQMCNNALGPSVVEVSTRPSEVTRPAPLSLRLLTKQLHGHSDLHKEAVFGLTKTDGRYDFQAKVTHAVLPDGSVCYVPKVQVTLWYDPFEVYVAREVDPQSCAYRHLLEHEMQHVAIYEKQLGQSATAMAKFLSEKLGTAARFSASLSAVSDELLPELHRLLTEEGKRQTLKMQEIHAEFDDEDIPHIFHGACGGHLKSILKTALES